MTIYLRGNAFHLRKRVPLRFRQIEEREIVAVSLKTDSPRLARRKADEVWNQLLEGWEAALSGDVNGAQARYRAAHNVAAHRGVDFVASRPPCQDAGVWIVVEKPPEEVNGREALRRFDISHSRLHQRKGTERRCSPSPNVAYRNYRPIGPKLRMS